MQEFWDVTLQCW